MPCESAVRGGCLPARERALSRKLISHHLHVSLPKKAVLRSGKVSKMENISTYASADGNHPMEKGHSQCRKGQRKETGHKGLSL